MQGLHLEVIRAGVDGDGYGGKACGLHQPRPTLHVTRHTSHDTRHTSHVTRHTTHVTSHTSHVTRHTLHVTRHTSHVTRYTSHVTRHTSHVTSHTSQVTRHTCYCISECSFIALRYVHDSTEAKHLLPTSFKAPNPYQNMRMQALRASPLAPPWAGIP
jgi:hypothetical protein